MKRRLGPNEWMQSAAAPLSRAVDRISTTFEAWRERRDLEYEFAHLRAHGEFERTLADGGISPSDVPRLMHMHPGATRQLDEMMSRVGLDRRKLVITPAIAGELRDMEWRCGECQSWRECRAWLRSETSPEGYRFCPNADAIERLRDHQVAPTVSRSEEGRSGVLAALNSGIGADLRSSWVDWRE